ncbi:MULTISPECIES: hypothetical protein [unclassified Frankia]|uniref:hypothetical protein n=1 Tax=unclassified Frankia TaxID=2632575 RepID=UPI002AD27D91|nr:MULTISPECIES: hypothetical protein [unclassified Frankia]
MVAAAVVALLGVAATVWTVVRGRLAQAHLRVAQTQLAQLERGLSAGRGLSVGQLHRTTEAIARETTAARRLTQGPVFAVAGRVPLVGCPVHTTRSLAVAVDDLAVVGLPAVVTVGAALRPAVPAGAGTAGAGTGLLSRLAGVRGSIDTARTALEQFRQRAARTSTCGAIGRLVGIQEAVAQAWRLSAALARTAQMLDLAGGLLRQ